ncbi:hypothetical protein [Actinomadura flavalba]|uniref:hypothetical protein n=1 Tax=Actinomadura flavalba TaxID=1120938 RepID=UPI00036C50C8|nr:hypothetical protein [Actinomadura flavalba]
MPRLTGRLLAAAAVPALALSLAAPAQAATLTWTITNPDATKDLLAWSGPNVLKNKAGKTVFTCDKTAILAKPGASRTLAPGAAYQAAVHGGSFSAGCKAPDGVAWGSGTLSGNYHLWLRATAYDAAADAADFTWTGQTGQVLVYGKPGCTFFLGDVKFRYSNVASTFTSTTGKVTFASNSPATNCAGLLTHGETVTFTGTYTANLAYKFRAATS